MRTTKQIAIRVNQQLLERLQRDADASNLHVSAHIRRVLSDWARQEDEETQARRQRRTR